MGKINQLGNSNGLGSNKQISLTQYLYQQKNNNNNDYVVFSNNFSIDNNSKQLKDCFEFDNGFFGEKGSSTSRRIIYDDDPIQTSKIFFDIISNGYIYKKEEKMLLLLNYLIVRY